MLIDVVYSLRLSSSSSRSNGLLRAHLQLLASRGLSDVVGDLAGHRPPAHRLCLLHLTSCVVNLAPCMLPIILQPYGPCLSMSQQRTASAPPPASVSRVATRHQHDVALSHASCLAKPHAVEPVLASSDQRGCRRIRGPSSSSLPAHSFRRPRSITHLHPATTSSSSAALFLDLHLLILEALVAPSLHTHRVFEKLSQRAHVVFAMHTSSTGLLALADV